MIISLIKKGCAMTEKHAGIWPYCWYWNISSHRSYAWHIPLKSHTIPYLCGHYARFGYAPAHGPFFFRCQDFPSALGSQIRAYQKDTITRFELHKLECLQFSADYDGGLSDMQ